MKRLFLIIVSIICILSLLASCTANDAWQDDFYTTGTIYSWNGTAFVPLGTGGGGTNDHSALINLDYASAGHTGFEPAILYPGNPAQYLDGTGNFSIPAGGGGGNVTASANLGDNTVIRGDGGALGVQDSGVTIDDFDNLNTNGGDIDGFDINAGNDINVTNDLDVTDNADIGGQLVVTGNISAQGNYVLTTDNVNDVPSNGNTTEPISSNWAYDHINEYATGSTFPATPWTGEMFLHSVTGRKILYSYSGTSWQPIISIGTMTLYVDATDGTDDTSHGTGVDGNAFATIQYAIDMIPGLVGGDVVIYPTAETYSETVTIQGKNYIGNYTITIDGSSVMTTIADIVGTGGVQGTASSTTAGTVTGNGFGAYDNYWILCTSGTNNGERRFIDSDSANTITLVDKWATGAPANGDTFTIQDTGVTVSSIIISPMQTGIRLKGLNINYTDTVITNAYLSNSESVLTYCKFSFSTGGSVRIRDGANITFDTCYAYKTRIYLYNGSFCEFKTSKSLNGSNTKCFICAGSTYSIYPGSVIDGNNAASYGVDISLNSTAGFSQNDASGVAHVYAIVRNNITAGLYAYQSGQIISTANNNYSGNGTNESATAASYGYID